MKVIFDPMIQRHFESTKSLQRKYGGLAKKLSVLVGNLLNCDRLGVMSLPGRPHPLKYWGDSVYSITLKHPFRCVFRISDCQECVTILDVVDYHHHQFRVS